MIVTPAATELPKILNFEDIKWLISITTQVGLFGAMIRLAGAFVHNIGRRREAIDEGDTPRYTTKRLVQKDPEK